MELVFVLLAVILLVVLPVAFLLFMVAGLVYTISWAIRGGKQPDAHARQTPPKGPGTPRPT